MKYDVVAFLDSLFRSEPDIIRDDLPAEWHQVWDERAAIIELDGRLPRERAEAAALAEVLRAMEQATVQSLLDTCLQ